MRRNTLRVIEPNLVGPSGHYAEFVRALASRIDGCFDDLEVLCDRSAELGSLAALRGIRFDRRFAARGRRMAEWHALRESCMRGGPFLVLTARAVDVAMLEAASAGAGTGLGDCRLYFHWRERHALKRAATACCVRTRRRALAIAPTASTAEFLRASGWRRVLEVPYPVIAPEPLPPPEGLRRLLVAGAARANKGISLVAALAERLAAAGDSVELLVQTTAKRRTGQQGGIEAGAIARMSASGPSGLRLDPRAPDRHGYVARFEGALVLTPYDPGRFADNVSGIALDALLHGAPVVATAGTWQAALVQRFGAGSVMARWDADSLSSAVSDARARWDECVAGARNAARTLAHEHDPLHLVRALAE
jgi:hypothetical protein